MIFFFCFITNIIYFYILLYVFFMSARVVNMRPVLNSPILVKRENVKLCTFSGGCSFFIKFQIMSSD